MSENPFLLPNELLAGAGVPAHMRAEVQYRVVTAKYCAVVELAMKLTGGEPLQMSLARVVEINHMDHLTDPVEMVMVAESRASPGGPSDVYDVRLATPDEVRQANRRYALSRMGASRN